MTSRFGQTGQNLLWMDVLPVRSLRPAGQNFIERQRAPKRLVIPRNSCTAVLCRPPSWADQRTRAAA